MLNKDKINAVAAWVEKQGGYFGMDERSTSAMAAEMRSGDAAAELRTKL